MKNVYFLHTCIAYILFLIAFILQSIPWPQNIYFLKPSWVYLVYSCLVVIFPEKVNIGTGFTLGIILDLFVGSKLGIQAFLLTILSYLIIIKLQWFRKVSLFKKTCLMSFFLFLIKFIIFSYIYLTNYITFQISYFGNILTDIVLWPWIFAVIKKIFVFFKIINRY
ncbi:MreD family transmembrane cell wall component [Wigglesworthia glossinidia endosymbiont of Glossina morsitans morsitans (Yale colony)]|uniref:Rod shape-determining protein MreD n=1 Tax=Wigglesworthia glossinidia endosymbiont of Glossina morsitans morsitans (Yale colony) TaxID=1142511 RepID=H6Q4D6_WIGGL|nr:rod shape-determining protein MreD [Wigglesworthia glossinidia]AFA40996.1 MreD family transmembrane cell wall component [Wigglesworthia glossinidia endosymbiont of Glossina morsitans morsitans (Yale colony)]